MVTAVLQKAIDAHTNGAFKEAEALYTQIISEEPKHPDANHNLGVLKVGSGKVEDALPLFKVALETNPSIQQFWISYIDAFMKLERWVDAKSILKQGKGLGLSGSAVEALEKELLERIAAHPDPLADRLNPIINQFNKGNYEETLGEIDELLKEFPNSPALQNIAGATLAKLQKFDEAISKLKSAIEAKPDFNEAYNNLANALNEVGRPEEAILIFKEALKNCSNISKVGLSESYRMLGDYKKAVRTLIRDITSPPPISKTIQGNKSFET